MAEEASKPSSSSAVEDLTPSSSQPSRLLTLPCEVRAKILDELLCHYEPLTSSYDIQNVFYWASEWKKPVPEFNLQTSILSTCRQLYDEGLPILRKKNTLGLNIWVDGTKPRLVLLGVDIGGRQGYPQKTKRWALLSEFRNLYIMVDFRRKNTSRIAPGRSADYRRVLHEAMKLMRIYCPKLPQNLTIAVPGREYYAADNGSGEEDALTALAMYPATGELKLDFVGVKPQTEQMLRTRLQDNLPMPDIYQMRCSLEIFIARKLGDRNEVVVALERLDISRFLVLRRRLIQEVEAETARTKKAVFREDLSRWKPKKSQLK
jgi:hypothetical protein